MSNKKPITVFGKKYQSITAACRTLGLNYRSVSRKLNRGATIHDAFTPESDDLHVKNIKTGDQLYEGLMWYLKNREESQ